MDYTQFVYLFAILGFGGYALKKGTEILKERMKQKAVAAKQAGVNASNPLAKYDSLHDFALSIEQGLDLQAKAISKECEKQHKNPMDDTGYQTVVGQYQQALLWRTRLEHPLGQVLDSFTFPLIKQAPTWIYKELPKMLR
jgi:hypothetical protein